MASKTRFVRNAGTGMFLFIDILYNGIRTSHSSVKHMIFNNSILNRFLFKLKRVLKIWKNYSLGIWTYYKYKTSLSPEPVYIACLYVNLQESFYKRYLYLFLKFFHIQGYSLYLPKKFHLIGQLKEDRYTSLLFKEKIVRFGKPRETNNTKIIQLNNLDPDYFRELLEGSMSENTLNTFHIPMSQHPLMYHSKLWKEEVLNSELKKRKRSIFIIGNFDPDQYKLITERRVFNVVSRFDMYCFLRHKEIFYPVSKTDDLTNFITGDIDNKILLVKKCDFTIPMKQLRFLLSQFDFFFALPGIFVPFSHNVVEAMSVGTIPFIQDTYAELFRPPLSHGINAYIFENVENVETRADELFLLSDEQISQMRKSVLEYYNNYLTPQSVIKRIESSTFDKIYLLPAGSKPYDFNYRFQGKLQGKRI